MSREKPHSDAHHPQEGLRPPADQEARAGTQHSQEASQEKPEQLRQGLKQAREEIQRLNDQHLRTLAEFDNAKKRLQREKEEFHRFASEQLVRRMLPIIDSLNQAVVAVEKSADAQPVITGVKLIYRQITDLLASQGVLRIPTVGEGFDPHRHEAIAQVESADGQADDIIVEEIQMGYTMHGKVIRPAMVKVAKAAHSTQQKADRKEKPADSEGSKDGETPTPKT